MEKRTLGKTGMNVTVLGYGGAEIGFRNVPVETVDQLINGALDAGLNVIDTAECYIESEEMIGQTVAHRRNEYFLFTKCGHDINGDSKAALYAVESGAFDTLQISVSIADQEAINMAVPAAQSRGMGVIAKRPIANA